MSIPELIIVQGDRVLLKRPGEKGFRKEAALTELLTRLESYMVAANSTPGEALPVPPHGAKAMWQGANGRSVIQVELSPTQRVVHWIVDNSKHDYGSNATDKPVSLTFPWIEIFIKCQGKTFTGEQCLFYRNAPTSSMDDTLHQSNLLNVSDIPGGMKAWFCSQYLKIPTTAETWNEKIRLMIEHLWAYTFNKSSEHHEGNSYWGHNHGLDKRIDTLAAWEDASKKDPNFMLSIDWPQMKHNNGTSMTIRSLVAEMLGLNGNTKAGVKITSGKQLLNVIRGLPKLEK